jgi:pfkB family carbohydrate kinase
MFMVCGEALMDVFATNDTPTGVALDARVGGSPYNVALGLARLAQPVSFFGSVSRGFLGERLMRFLGNEGVNLSTVQRSDAPTTLGLVGLDAQGVPSYSFYGDGCADRLLTADALAAVPAGLRAINFGSFTTVTEPTASTLRALVEREHGRTLIAYDPNVRLNVEPAEGQRRGPAPAVPRPRDCRLRGANARTRREARGRDARRRRRGGVDREAEHHRAAGQGEGDRHRGCGRHLPGRAADLAGRARCSVGGCLAELVGCAVDGCTRLRGTRRGHHLLAAWGGSAASRRAELSGPLPDAVRNRACA